jgi:hypothetical protein
MNYLQELQTTRNNLLEQLANIDTNYLPEDENIRQQVINQLNEVDNLIENFYATSEFFSYPRKRSGLVKPRNFSYPHPTNSTYNPQWSYQNHPNYQYPNTTHYPYNNQFSQPVHNPYQPNIYHPVNKDSDFDRRTWIGVMNMVVRDITRCQIAINRLDSELVALSPR